jgi:hypothetical protein
MVDNTRQGLISSQNINTSSHDYDPYVREKSCALGLNAVKVRLGLYDISVTQLCAITVQRPVRLVTYGRQPYHTLMFLTYPMEQSPFREANRVSAFMEPKGSLTHSQVPAT